MGRRRFVLALLGTGLVLAASGATRAEGASVARSHLLGSGPSGAVFFLPAPGAAGVVAVGAAHSFDRTALAESGRVTFRAGPAAAGVAVSARFFAKPGRSYDRQGATLRDDYLIFALESAPAGVEVLEADAALPGRGDRVAILGLPASGREKRILGRVVGSEHDRIEIDLDDFADLRGWGGAPVVRESDGRVIGLLQSAWPEGGRLRVGVGPIGGVLDAIASPYEGGVGRLFATMAPLPSAATGLEARRRAATGSAFGDASPDQSAAAARTAVRAGDASSGAGPIRLVIAYPPPDTVVGEAAGAFLAGSAVALGGASARFDVMIVLDTSGSTSTPTGVDVDGDGEVGVPIPGATDGAVDSSDPDDSILAAEVAAAERLLEGLDPSSTRVGLVSFAGVPVALPAMLGQADVRRAVLTRQPLTFDYDRVRASLLRLRELGSYGGTHMAAGVDQATVELMGLPGSVSRSDPASRKVVLFFTDGAPTLPHPSDADNVRAVLLSAARARRAGIRIHSFAIGPEALAGPISAVEMAAITNGLFTPVRHPGRLVGFMEQVSFANVSDVAVRNQSAGGATHGARVHADGSWDALVPLRPGENQLLVQARSTQGEEASQTLTVHHVPGSPSPPLPVELVPKHNALLEARLAGIERERVERLRKELVLEIEREREAAVERAVRQRKELEIEVERTER